MVLCGLLGALIAAVPFLTLIGLGVHRGASAWAVAGAATLLTFGPALLSGAAAPEHRRGPVSLGVLALWSAALFQLLVPVYFPGERTGAFRTGITLIGGDPMRRDDSLASALPDEPSLARPVAEVAQPVPEPELPPPLDEDALALPYEGDGRRMAVPVVFEHDGAELEVVMMFDTGATYTTLSLADLAALGLSVGPDAPRIELHTANGVRTASLVMVDTVWLGNLAVDHVAIATCESCASSDTAGLLGLNVSGGFNLQIDADRQEVMFRPRSSFDRKLDVRVFTDLSATFERLPGGRVEVVASLANPTDVEVRSVVAEVSCASGTWQIPVGPVPPRESLSQRRALPEHPRCERYDLTLAEASW
jgi:hypothetical protein